MQYNQLTNYYRDFKKRLYFCKMMYLDKYLSMFINVPFSCLAD